MFTHFYTFSHDLDSPSIPFTKCWYQSSQATIPRNIRGVSLEVVESSHP